ncbi:MAG: hypothetical protein LBQ39_04385 [Tannerellaceae bacterium]|nr:hypothetical protein [Tannerellaceae bacterium]
MGCGARKVERTEVRRDSLSVMVGDSLFAERLWRQSGRRQVRVERIELSMPDSAGRQYARAITVATVGEEVESASLDAVQSGRSATLRRETTSAMREAIRPASPASGLGWWGWGLLLLAVVGGCVSYSLLK